MRRTHLTTVGKDDHDAAVQGPVVLPRQLPQLRNHCLSGKCHGKSFLNRSSATDHGWALLLSVYHGRATQKNPVDFSATFCPAQAG